MPRQNIQNMTPQEMAQYVETVRARNRLNAKKYYNEKIKTDPEKYEKFKVKCKEPNRKYYYKGQELTNPTKVFRRDGTVLILG